MLGVMLNVLQASGEWVTLIGTLPGIGFPNGIYSPSPAPGLVLLADSTNGVIWRIDTVTGGYTHFLEDPAFRVPPNATFDLGINGIEISATGDKVWFTNTAAGIVGEISITPSGAVSAAKVLARIPEVDDFASTAGQLPLYVVGDNALWRVDANGTHLLAGGPDDVTLEGATAVAQGRTYYDQSVYYISTNGGLPAPVNGQVTGGKILAVNVAVVGIV